MEASSSPLHYAKKVDDAKGNSADMSEKVDVDGSEEKAHLHDCDTTDVQAHHTAQDIPAENPVESNLHMNPDDGGVSRSVSISSPSYVEKVQPQPQCALLPLNTESHIIYEVNQSFTSKGKSQIGLKSTSVHTEAGEDLCAAILLACLFCHPLDCLLATMRGCNDCVWSLCSYLCGCKPASLQPLLDATHYCDLCSCVGIRCLLCDCTLCDICIQATECLDLAMEISQMLFH
ncbi:uncharacterized protein si:dkey-245f22.3 [Solea solea]|uniref:uncharacterized protein si:dkey-245f22.3 n=1 Tax=Solea solea TaxID=90069 RepID=UPI00272A8D75|nr:uncharacterized protein si:dkey-245f22.3 [Solea solea]